VDKAREKYEQDCMKINSYTAQSSLVQGKDLEKIQLKLDRAKQTVQSNEREFANFTRAFESTVQRWEQDWKAFCDGCQDLEEARIDFMKDNMWSYTNIVSTVCVADDEVCFTFCLFSLVSLCLQSCERIRVSLEQMETEREIDNFVSLYGTGPQIPDPPTFINYQSPDATPSSAAQPTFRSASFIRSTARDVPVQLYRNVPPQEEDLINIAGRGAGGGGTPRRTDTHSETNNLTRQPTQRNSIHGVLQQQQPYANGVGFSCSSNKPYQHQITGSLVSPGVSATLAQRPMANATSSSQLQSSHRPTSSAYDPHTEPVDPTAETYIKVGNNAYRVDPSKDPQMNPGTSGSGSGSASRAGPSATKHNGIDPLQKQLEELQSGLSALGSNRRNTIRRQSVGPTSENPVASSSRQKGNDMLSAGTVFRSSTANSPSPAASGSGLQQLRDYKNSAELVVGAPPQTSSRPASPNPPVANFMIPKNSNGNHGAEVVTDVLADYHQHLPGERNSRRVSPASGDGAGASGHSHSLSVSSQQAQGLARAPSIGHAGIGAHGGNSRGNSPQPSASRGPSPGPGEIVRLGNMSGHPPQISPQPQPQRHQLQHLPQQKRTSTLITSPSTSTPIRDTSPNPVGIALDPNGRVSHDEMAQRYQMQQQQRGQTPQSHQHMYGGIQQQSQHPQPNPQQQQRRSSWLTGVPAPGAPQPPIAPPAQPMYSSVTPPPPQLLNMYQVPPPPPLPQSGYATAASGQGMYNQYSQQSSTGFQQPASQQQQQQIQSAYAVMNNTLVGRQQGTNSINGNGFNGRNASSSHSSSSLAVRNGGGDGYRVPSPGPEASTHVGRSPSPQSVVQQMLPQVQPVHQLTSQTPMTHQYQSMQQVPVSASQSIQQQMQGQGQGQLTHTRFSVASQQQIRQTTEDGKQIMFYGTSYFTFYPYHLGLSADMPTMFQKRNSCASSFVSV